MRDLPSQFACWIREGAAVVGIGNLDYGDDGVGQAVAKDLCSLGVAAVDAGTEPERHLMALARRGLRHLVMVDAVDFGAAAGDVVVLESGEIQSRYPQVSTHKLSLGLLAWMVETEHACRVWLLGVQPGSLQSGPALSARVQATRQALVELWADQSRQQGGRMPNETGTDLAMERGQTRGDNHSQDDQSS